MKQRKKCSYFKGMFSFILGLVFVLNLFQGFQAEASSGTDLTNSPAFVHLIEKFQVRNYNSDSFSDIIKDGKVVISNDQKIYKDDTTRIFYKFSVNSAIQVGDYFYINLPSSAIFKGTELLNRPLMDGSKKIGEISMNTMNQLKVTFTKSGNAIKDGFIFAGGTFHREGNQVKITLPGMNGESVDLTVEKRPDTEVNKFTPGRFPKKSDFKIMTKYGVYQYGTDKNYFSYSLGINEDEESKLFKQNVSKKGRINKREDVFIIDELPEGQTFSSTDPSKEEIRLSVKLKVPAYQNDRITEDDMSDVGGFNSPFLTLKNAGPSTVTTASGKQFFKIVKEDGTSKTWEAFQTEIQNATKRTIGIYNNEKMIVKIGSLPMGDVTYGDFFGNDTKLEEKIEGAVNAGTISSKQKERMVTAYKNQPVVGFTFEYRTFLKGNDYSDVYVNKAIFKYNKNKTFEVGRRTPFDWLKGGATLVPFTANLKVVKKWYGAVPSLPEGIKVQLYNAKDNQNIGSVQILNTSNSWTHTFSGLSENDGSGAKIDYKIKEVNPPSGYRNFIKRTSEGFEIINIEQVVFKVNKVWQKSDGSQITAPDLPIKVGLYKSGSSVPLEIIDLKNNSGEFKKVDKADASGDISYHVKEENTPAGFDSDSALVGDTFTLTNKKVDASTREIKVRKFWKASTGAYVDGAGKPQITVKLVKEGSDAAVQTKILNEGNSWEDTFTGLPVFDGDNFIKYQVIEETALDGYDPAVIEGNMDEGFQITNREKSTEIKVTKLWQDEKGEKLAKSDMPDVEITLKKNGADFEKRTLSLMDSWFTVFEGLPIAEGGQPIRYTVEEKVQVSGFQKGMEILDPEEANSYLVINKELPTSPPGGGYPPVYIPEEPEKVEPKPEEPKKDENQTEEPKEDENKTEEPKEDENKTEEPKEENPKKEEEKPEYPDSKIPPLPTIFINPEDPILSVNEDSTPIDRPYLSSTEIDEDEIPLAPSTPPNVPIISDEIPEILLDGDDVPLGSQSVELAKSGGLLVRFKFVILGFGVLLLSLICLEIYRRKRKNHL